jgi:DNA-binding transcriptional LysR family regulator
MQTFDWNDFRYVLAVAEQGSITAAARRLAVTHSTVLRRINAFEERVGARVFERLASGYRLTPGGEELAEVAHAMAEQLVALERRIAGRDRRVAGTVRFTTTDSLMSAVVMGEIEGFRARHPDVRLDISTATGVLDLAAREADVALRATAKPPDSLVGWRLSALTFAVYGPRNATIEGTRRIVDPLRDGRKLPWLMPSGNLARNRVGTFVARHVDSFRLVATFDSFLAIRDAVERGLGYAIMPCYLGDYTPGLVRLGQPISELSLGLWLLTHKDLRSVPRVRAVMDHMFHALSPMKARFEGTSAANARPRRTVS